MREEKEKGRAGESHASFYFSAGLNRGTGGGGRRRRWRKDRQTRGGKRGRWRGGEQKKLCYG